jgi:membrane protease YdiL (CAAX protease family)
MKKWIAAGFMVAIYFTIQGMIELLRIAPRIFSAQTLRDHEWIGFYEHHFWQLTLALIAIGFFSRGKYSEWGLNLRNRKIAIHILVRFMCVYTLIILAVNVLPFVVQHRPPVFSYPLTPVNIAAWLAYMGLFVGVSEEILFRGLIHTYLAKTWLGVWKVGGMTIPSAGFATTIIFCIAHVGSVHVNWPQQAFAFGLGLYYSTVYHRTGSLLNPILAHNYSDGIIYVALYSTYYWLR